jgi:hypothetical protein
MRADLYVSDGLQRRGYWRVTYLSKACKRPQGSSGSPAITQFWFDWHEYHKDTAAYLGRKLAGRKIDDAPLIALLW